MTDVKATIPAVHPSCMQLAEHMRNEWSVTVPNGATKEDLLRPEFWAHLAAKLRPADLIEVRTMDGTYAADLEVRDSGRQYAKVVVRHEYRYDSVEPQGESSIPAGHSVQWSGPHTKFRVIRESDKKMLKDGFASKADAYGWLASYGKAIAA